ncbi:uncharacterized protein LOC118736869 [Rhagoletis pomonella]|uniref:uncharacterized protein LOC118736869 n=1 Tax=Rhagoletis pomonella TaxID=28610 RepID=UPI001786720F|nr:uncharacterized protein LOC118736869 [Rhagoletis pomonella]
MFECCGNYISTYRQDYKERKSPFAKGPTKIEQCDESLISNHYWRPLQVNGAQVKSKVWPKTKFGVEEYKHFVKRLEKCKKELYNMFFRSPCVDAKAIEQMLRDLEKSTYMISYSPNCFQSRKESRRFLRTAQEKSNMKYYETTYGTYYNRIKELDRFKDVLYGMISKPDRTEFHNELTKLFITGVTTYEVSYNIPGLEQAKKKKLRDGPIDRYTLRAY